MNYTPGIGLCVVIAGALTGCSAPPERESGTGVTHLGYTVSSDGLDKNLFRELKAVAGDGVCASFGSMVAEDVPYSGLTIWVPGTGEHTDDVWDGSHHAMGAVPSGLRDYGPAVDESRWSPDALGPANGPVWHGIASAEAAEGYLFAQKGPLSALSSFDTGWSDAVAIVSRFGERLRGAWIVGHSAGALPAILAGLLGGAHRIDAYGIPSAVGKLDGVVGKVNLHTHDLDPVDVMGVFDSRGHIQIDYGSLAARIIQSGNVLPYHDYSGDPAPSP